MSLEDRIGLNLKCLNYLDISNLKRYLVFRDWYELLNTFTWYWPMVCYPIGFKHRWGGLFWSNFLSAIIFNLWDTLPILCYHIGFILCKIEHWRVNLLYHEINNQSRGGLRSNHGSKSTQPVPFKTNDSAFNETQCSLIFQEILHQKSLQKSSDLCKFIWN